MAQVRRQQRLGPPAITRGDLVQRLHEAGGARGDFLGRASSQLDRGVVVQLQLPAAARRQRQALDRHVQRLEQGLERTEHRQHLVRLIVRAGQRRQLVGFDFAHVGFEDFAEAVDHARFAVAAPQGHGTMFLQLHPQAVRKVAPHLRLAHPRDMLERVAHGREIHGEEVAGEPRHHVGAQCGCAVVRDVTLDGDGSNCKQRTPQRPAGARCQQQHQADAKQRRGGVVHQPDVGGHGHGSSHLPHTPFGWSSAANASNCRHRSS